MILESRNTDLEASRPSDCLMEFTKYGWQQSVNRWGSPVAEEVLSFWVKTGGYLRFNDGSTESLRVARPFFSMEHCLWLTNY